MKKAARKYLLFVIITGIVSMPIFAQVYTNKEVGKHNEELKDSLKKTDYPYSLPIWGAKATKKGYSLPYSAGISVQYFQQESDIVIDNLQVGFNNGTMYDLDGLVRFNNTYAKAGALTVRPDIWLLPFLNVYAILGSAAASTNVGFGVWIPDSSGTEKEIFSTSTKVEFNSTTFGIGFTPTIGVWGCFLALDMNVAWTDVPQLNKPARSFVFGPRLGKSFKLKKPERTVAAWVGGFRVNISSGTDGSINLSEVLPADMGGKIQSGITKVDNAQQQVDTWWGGLTPAEQNNPVNVAKYNSANNVLAKAGEILNAANTAVSNIENGTVQYSMDKRPKDAWNFIIGSQYQFNKHWMLRAEVGFLGSRTQGLAGVQYRFGL
jgi:opacity protein-like surface antigen